MLLGVDDSLGRILATLEKKGGLTTPSSCSRAITDIFMASTG